MSVRTNAARSPSPAAAVSPRDSFRAAMTTDAPAACSAAALASPSFELPPVTIATVLVSSGIEFCENLVHRCDPRHMQRERPQTRLVSVDIGRGARIRGDQHLETHV